MLIYKLTRFLCLVFIISVYFNNNFCWAQDSIVNKEDKLASFPGGEQEFSNYLAKNIVYPSYEKENNITVNVIVCFEINKEENVTNARILKSASKGFNNEALRVIRSMPLWKTAFQYGKAVRSEYSIPINFNLTEAKFNSGKIIGYFVGGMFGFATTYYLISKL